MNIESRESIDEMVHKAEDAILQGNIPLLILIYERMAELGHWRALTKVGELYETGFAHGQCHFEKNLDTAAQWYRRAISEADDPMAHLGLGRICYEGTGTVLQDYKQAWLHLEYAYQNCLPQAGIYLGVMCMFGVGREKDLLAAQSFLKVAAEGGFPLAYRYLANIAAAGGNHVTSLKYLLKEFLMSARLKMQDRQHPNLWRLPK